MHENAWFPALSSDRKVRREAWKVWDAHLRKSLPSINFFKWLFFCFGNCQLLMTFMDLNKPGWYIYELCGGNIAVIIWSKNTKMYFSICTDYHIMSKYLNILCPNIYHYVFAKIIPLCPNKYYSAQSKCSNGEDDKC